jgi:uncharacterized protein (TIGR00251 family)
MQVIVLVKPGSKKGPLVEPNDNGSLTLFVRAKAVDGAANEAVTALLAKHFGVAKSQVVIARGHTSRHKVVEVNGAKKS